MTNKPVGLRQHMTELADEQQALEQGLAHPLVPHRLEQITSELDQCWAEIERHAHAAAAEPVDHAQGAATSPAVYRNRGPDRPEPGAAAPASAAAERPSPTLSRNR